MSTAGLTADQLAAVKSFARGNGRNWKSELRSAWETGNYASYGNSRALQEIRNTLGSKWLIRLQGPASCHESDAERTGGALGPDLEFAEAI